MLADRQKVLERLVNKIEFTDSCWIWTAGVAGGYGRIRINGKQMQAHRVSYRLFVGKLCKGLVINHLCENKLCVNPDHLEQVSYSDNTRYSRGPFCRVGHFLDAPGGRIPTKKGGCWVCKRAYLREYYHSNKGKSRAR